MTTAALTTSDHAPQPNLLPVPVLHNGQTWTVYQGDTTPYIRDLEWAAHLGYARPRKVRDLIKRMADAGQLGVVFSVCPTVGQTGGRPSVEYYLTQGQALKVAARAETDPADRILDDLVQVFLLAQKRRDPVADIVAEFRAERIATIQALTAIVTMVGEMTKRAPALPESAAVHVVPPVIEKEWVTTAEAITILGLNHSALYETLRRRGTRGSIRRRRTTKTGKHGVTHLLWHLSDLRLALTGRKSASIPEQVWTAEGPLPPAQPTLPNVVPIRPDVAVEQPKQEPAKFVPTALRDAVLYTVRTTVRDMHLTPENKHRLWLVIYEVFRLRFRYDPRKMHAKKQKAIEYIEQRGDMAGLLQVAQEVCEALKKKGLEYLQEQSA